ncbi:4-(cytidine 5'-diphospho)-2-C-methyl-D-erythritol kinase [Rhodopseudomonas sp. WA056]|uniref:4-(cytidine 5'-diphospho)-2-C-methyl-D-erythritol kinase n=1 Tax=Rhodopseudomonas sp. WA056 TaxID=2269367 RepID=UPI0013DED362|nr:4-(cytidine 5'-diphospho)-2-C-methyl-D-erythritol kinase [Rhodopseudomonas sp. WA056]
MTDGSATTLRDEARAKVNLTLRVVGRRIDGYHELESVVAFADCADRLELQPGAALSLATTGPGAQDCGDSADNLVLKAARLLSERVPNLTTGAFILDKHLPVAAGIGGGSADAAAALRLLARANDLAADDPRLVEAARLTGADVPVCLPSRPCMMAGVGEKLSPLPLPRLPAVMVNPRVPVATKDVFAALGLKPGSLTVGATDVLAAPAWPDAGAPLADWIATLEAGTNDLEPPALKVEPVVGTVLAALRATVGVQLARMSGSGATCFALYADDASARAAADMLRTAQPGWWVHAGSLS